MESTECSLEELLCRSLVLFRQCRFYDNCQESEVEASRLLEEAHVMAGTKNVVDMAKWGCTLECLAQKYYINGDTDELLGNLDTRLADFWKKTKASSVDAFSVYLWLGYYFLLRFRNRKSCCHTRCKRAISEILSFLIEILRKFKNKSIPEDIVSLFPADVWGETVYWVELVHDSCLCEKRSATLLELLYDLKKAELSKCRPEQNILLQQILEFYCF